MPWAEAPACLLLACLACLACQPPDPLGDSVSSRVRSGGPLCTKSRALVRPLDRGDSARLSCWGKTANETDGQTLVTGAAQAQGGLGRNGDGAIGQEQVQVGAVHSVPPRSRPLSQGSLP